MGAAVFDSILSCFLSRAKPDMRCQWNRWEEISRENACGKMVRRASKSHELGRGGHLCVLGLCGKIPVVGVGER